MAGDGLCAARDEEECEEGTTLHDGNLGRAEAMSTAPWATAREMAAITM